MILLSPLAFAVNDVTLTSDAIISVSGYNLNIAGGQYTVDSIVVSSSSSSFDVTLSTGATFKISSADRRKLTVSPTTNVTVTSVCNSTLSSVDIKATAATTVTVTPSTTDLCVSSDGGGGMFVIYNYSQATPATPAAAALEHASSVAQSVSPAFNKDMVRGQRSDDVKRLQQLLATDKSIYPEGLATGFFGPATERAIRAFQKKHGLPQVGRVGPATRAKLQEVFGSKVSTAQSAVTESLSSPATLVQMQALIEELQKQIQELLRQRGQ